MKLTMLIFFSVFCAIDAVKSFKSEKKGTAAVVALWAAASSLLIVDIVGVKSPMYDIISYLGNIFGVK